MKIPRAFDEANRKRREQETGCEFCNGKTVERTSDRIAFSYAAYLGEMEVECTRQGWECSGRTINIPINFCPMCGLKLEG